MQVLLLLLLSSHAPRLRCGIWVQLVIVLGVLQSGEQDEKNFMRGKEMSCHETERGKTVPMSLLILDWNMNQKVSGPFEKGRYVLSYGKHH